MLSVISTPIGNLGDISERAKAVLSSCHAIVCEDTRVTGMLLSLLGLQKKELLSLHSYSDERKLQSILDRLNRGEHMALVSDAGTPGISDPGFALVFGARSRGIAIEGIPGPAAFLLALSISGLPINQFVYLGFLPLKKGRRRVLESIANEKRTVVFYESPHRIAKTLKELAVLLYDQPLRPVVICRELTKMHEEVISMTVSGIETVLPSLIIKGEFCIVIGQSEIR